MKRKVNHFEREAWIMAMIPLAIIVIGLVAGWLVNVWAASVGRHPH